MFERYKLRKYKRQSKALIKEIDELWEEYNDAIKKDKELRKKIDHKYKELERFQYNVYAKAVFEYYKKKKPLLVNIHDDSVVKWDDVFPNNFENVSNKNRYNLICLFENDGGLYRLK